MANMANPKLNEAAILARFDSLVKEGIVFYNPDQRIITHKDQNNLTYEFRITSALTHKPTPGQLPTPSRYAPGSDIDVTGFEISPITTTHLLAANKFSAARPHLLLLTTDGHARQHAALDAADWAAAHAALSALTTPTGSQGYMLFFNCGVAGGCSRLHKHMQIIPRPAPGGLWLDGMVADGVPYVYFMERFRGQEGWLAPGGLEGVYRGLLGRAERALEAGGEGEVEEGRAVPHNVLLTRDWMAVIPRRKPGVRGANANAPAMLGMVWLADEEVLGRWLGIGPSVVLADVGVPV
ncbi:hypothetical protein B0H67DRAFT_388268 [Lasiosphaeris hirsuta]|uniref:ATP adenylyltransferase n=1 Tax=Lasiosphaeris hirsuta TaxID=260670 RepID=A0AA39ZXU1_9PEZI|nr:hypothetical protein B0H67DRAFT_388268 [Lasiosphaeris hirsuta]